MRRSCALQQRSMRHSFRTVHNGYGLDLNIYRSRDNSLWTYPEERGLSNIFETIQDSRMIPE